MFDWLSGAIIPWEAWGMGEQGQIVFVLGILALVVFLLTFKRYAPDMVLMGGLSLLLVGGVLTPHEALEGFANEGLVTVAVLYIVAEGLRQTG